VDEVSGARRLGEPSLFWRPLPAEPGIEGQQLQSIQKGPAAVICRLRRVRRPQCRSRPVVSRRRASCWSPAAGAALTGDRTRGLEVLGDALRLGPRGALAKPFRVLQWLDLVAEVLGPDRASENSVTEGDQ
jgi:hypothetical protein